MWKLYAANVKRTQLMGEAMTKMMMMKMKDEDGMDGRSLHGESGCVRVCSSVDMCFLLLPGPEKKLAFFLLISKKKKTCLLIHLHVSEHLDRGF